MKEKRMEQSRVIRFVPSFYNRAILFAKIAGEQTLKAAAVAGFVLAHLMYRVVDGIQAELLCASSQLFFTLAGAVFSRDAELQVFLGVRKDHFTQQFS